jgi:hypothetical protein
VSASPEPGERAAPAPTLEVAVFFYGSYMNPAVLREAGLDRARFAAARLEPARLPGYDLVIRPLANLVPSDGHAAYGVLARATHAELERLYAHARDVLGGSYLPRPVVVETRDGELVPALCYVAPALVPRAAAADYVERILATARRLGFPGWYLERIASFGP